MCSRNPNFQLHWPNAERGMDNPDYNVEDPVTSVRQSWIPRVRAGGVQQKKLFFLGPPLQRGLEGKKTPALGSPEILKSRKREGREIKQQKG